MMNYLITTLTNQYLLEPVGDNIYADKNYSDIMQLRINTIHSIQKYLDNCKPCFVVTTAGACVQVFNIEEIPVDDTYIQY